MAILLWAGEDRCDWFVSGPDVAALERRLRQLLPYSDLRSSLWALDEEGSALLDRVQAAD
ncbi:MAG TPA: hypothetical protein VFJ85_17395 [Acidimicrobiales bacterium]|nr:hypothetical protein [Acidimicrobiales bacterium]